MRLQSKESFLDDYIGGYMQLNAEKLQNMESDELEELMEGVEKKACELWEYFNKCKQVGKRIKAGELEYGSVEFYEAMM